MKKILVFLLTFAMLFTLVSCGGSGDNKGEISVFYYTYSDAYISSVRAAMDKQLEDAGLNYNDYDGNNANRAGTDSHCKRCFRARGECR